MQFKNRIRNEFGKCDHPQETVRRIREGFNNLGLEPVYSGVNASQNLYWGQAWVEDLHLICEGKGCSSLLSRASAFAELAERFSAGMFYPAFEKDVRFNVPALYAPEVRNFLNFQWLPGYVYGHQEAIPEGKVTVEELLKRETHLGQGEVEEMKGSDLARHWVDGFSLRRNCYVKVPLPFASYIHGSNGLAAGNTLEEALIQGSSEIFERYALIETIRPERKTPTIDPSSVQNPLIQEMISFYEKQGVEVRIKDLSFNGSLPVIGVLFTNKNLPRDLLEYNVLIAGAAFDSDEALTRCFTEGIQGRRDLQKPRKHLDKKVAPREQVSNYYLIMRCGVSPKDISFLQKGPVVDYSLGKRGNTGEEIEALIRTCREMQTDCILVDHTHPKLRFPVVRVIMPGISDFLPFINKDVLTHPNSKPSSPEKGAAYLKAMRSFFP